MRLCWPKDTPPSNLPSGAGTWNPPGVARVNWKADPAVTIARQRSCGAWPPDNRLAADGLRPDAVTHQPQGTLRE